MSGPALGAAPAMATGEDLQRRMSKKIAQLTKVRAPPPPPPPPPRARPPPSEGGYLDPAGWTPQVEGGEGRTREILGVGFPSLAPRPLSLSFSPLFRLRVTAGALTTRPPYRTAAPPLAAPRSSTT